MPATGSLTLGKKERIAGKRLVETLFKGGVSRSMSCYPLRAVYALVPMTDDGSSAKMMVSVPKQPETVGIYRSAFTAGICFIISFVCYWCYKEKKADD